MKKARSIEEKIINLWEEVTGGEMHHFIDLKNHTSGVKLVTLEDTYEYPSIKEAADECLYTIGEWLKEV